MFALINQMTAFDNYVGSVISLHRSMEAAEKADAKLQRMIKRNNGQNAYLPTVVCQVKGRPRAGQIHVTEIINNNAMMNNYIKI